MVRFRILGGLEAVSPLGSATVSGEFQRRLLQTLLVSEGRAITGDMLMTELWGELPPAGAANALQAHASRIRRKIRQIEPHRERPRLICRPNGYQLLMDGAELDATAFVESVARAERIRLDAPEQAVGLLRPALRLWSGAVCGGSPGGPLCRAAAARYEERRLQAMEALFDSELMLGRHAAILAELREVHMDDPLRERFCEQLMVALYRSGRQAEALGTCRRTWQCLIDQLGVDPSPSLRRVEHAILAQDPALDRGPVSAVHAARIP
ncbi:AfsR/SARP family transcriptional regulator [Streptomyces sp. SB3404]|uniref:AfsR/SARP family transcriptional regulator n=1 Tax=Streptomyces boncukensis TaxID=2711219 RepID=A0A6G4WP32_9ACTN|nr:AfsR/SARP family transcriptional regulator [Streptomyces boncukensis]